MEPERGRFVGTVTAKDGDRVSFTVERTVPVTHKEWPVGSIEADPGLPAGSSVAVRYTGGTAKYLKVGTSYSVMPIADGDGWRSSVARAEDIRDGCGRRLTVYADGRRIDTSLLTFGPLHTGGILVLVLGSVVVVGSGWLLVRHRRARRDWQERLARWEASQHAPG